MELRADHILRLARDELMHFRRLRRFTRYMEIRRMECFTCQTQLRILQIHAQSDTGDSMTSKGRRADPYNRYSVYESNREDGSPFGA